MLSLRVFGGLALTDSAGPVSPRAVQRRRLAVLAIVAVSRTPSVTRDTLVALLWPEADTERARHLLADSLYVLRDALGADVLLTTGDDVSLNPERLRCDAAEFLRAIEVGNRLEAVSITESGPFLDGVHISDAPEFERWVESTRAWLRDAYRTALEELADDASRRGDVRAAADHWRRLASEDRLSSRAALGYMRALAASGDRTGALEYFRVYKTTIRAELEVEPDASVAVFADQLRADTGLVPPARPSPVLKSEEEPVAPIAAAPQPAEARTRQRATRRAVLITTAVAAIALIVVALRAGIGPTARDARPSLAVLPLVALDTNATSQAFADGLTSELIDAMTAIPGLDVIGSTSVFALKGQRIDARRIADTLKVARLLEGDIERDGSRIKLRLRLVDGTTGAATWSETFRRDLADAWTVQDDIGRAVAAALGVRLATGASPRRLDRRTTNVVAYDLYLRGRSQREQRNDTAFKLALADFDEAIAADTAFAAAYAALSETATVLGGATNSPQYPRMDLYARARAAAQRAIALDDSSPDAHVALGVLRANGEIDLRAAEAELRRALALDAEHRRAHEYLALVDCWTGRADEALREARRAAQLDPLSVTARREIARALFYLHRYDDALGELDRIHAMGAPLRAAAEISAEIHGMKGMYPEAIAELRGRRGILSQALLGNVLARSGQRDEATRIREELERRYTAGTGGAYFVAAVYAGLRDFDQAFAWLERSFDDRSTHFTLMDPTFDELRADPRFARIRTRLGL